MLHEMMMSKPSQPSMDAPRSRPMQSPSASDQPFIPPMGAPMVAHGAVEEDDEDALDDEDDEKDVLLSMTPEAPTTRRRAAL